MHGRRNSQEGAGELDGPGVDSVSASVWWAIERVKHTSQAYDYQEEGVQLEIIAAELPVLRNFASFVPHVQSRISLDISE